MKAILEKIDSKTLATIITSAGGILLAGALIYLLMAQSNSFEKILTNDLNHINESVKDQTAVQQETNGVLRDTASAIQSNTEVLKIIERRMK